MVEHVRHLLRSASYNSRSALSPRKAASLGRAWFRNELAYLRRTSRLDRILADPEAIRNALAESRNVLSYCEGELRRHSMLLPGLLNPNYGPSLYALARVLRPEAIVETGVGSGVSSTFWLSALHENGSGRLYSVDLPLPNERLLPETQKTGWLVPEELRERWELTLADARHELPALLERVDQVDFFYHDSDHSYEHMTWEFSLAHPRVRKNGLLLSDDITANRAWDDFVGQHNGPRTRINRLGILRKDEA